MLRSVGLSLALASVALVACGGSGEAPSGSGGMGASSGSGAANGGSAGGVPLPNSCEGVKNAPGPMVDMAWPAASNVGHDAVPGDTVHFHWSGSHDVLEVATFDGQTAPTPTFGDAHWPGEITSGPKTNGGSFDWNLGWFPCGYRPGIYFFVDDDSPAGGIVSLSYTAPQGSADYAPRPCSDLSNPVAYGGRFSQFAGRKGCTAYEVNNFQTEAHFDWVPPTFAVQQGDVVVFRWTGLHNIVQVHDVTQDALMTGGIDSGAKTNCVGGPQYACVNGTLALGDFLFDSTDYRPGLIHISDACAMTCTGHSTGMNTEFMLQFPTRPVPPVAGSCCAIDPTKGTACRVVDIYNDNEGSQFDYNIPVGKGDLLRFRWAGKLQVVQTTPNADGSPSKTAKPGGVAMPAPVDCTPGPHMTCLQGNTSQAELVVDIAKEVAKGNYATLPSGQPYFDFYGFGENTDGFTSQDTGTLIYVDDGIPYDPNPPACP